MGLVYADIELINYKDVALGRKHVIGEGEIRWLHLNMLVDSGAYMMATNETIQAQLEHPFIEERKIQMAGVREAEGDVAGPVNVKFSNKKSTCSAFVLPGDIEPFLGAISVEEMPARLSYFKMLPQTGIY